MELIFKKLNERFYPHTARNTAFLVVDNWDDYCFKTTFFLAVNDGEGINHEIGHVKIGYTGQEEGKTSDSIERQFDALGEHFFSLGQDADYYERIRDLLSTELKERLLTGLGDIVYSESRLKLAQNENVFSISILRSGSLSAIHNQYRRILTGAAELTDYNFRYERKPSNTYGGIKLDFHVEKSSMPSTNVHIIIGRNGVGKTTLLNNMVDAILPRRKQEQDPGKFSEIKNTLFKKESDSEIPNDYFSSVVSVAFSAFDPFIPPPTQQDRSLGTCYFYIGLKINDNLDTKQKNRLKDSSDLCKDFAKSIDSFFGIASKKSRWVEAIRKLETDSNFKDKNLRHLAEIEDQEQVKASALNAFKELSSGHAIVLLSITRLVETVEEKSLVLIDEPESHLHPPLLSAFIRALSELLLNQNGVAIIATHSPVILQEVPKTCVSIIRRTGDINSVDRPENETFGENVGVLTREVFDLEVSKSGFHDLLLSSVNEGKSYDEIIDEYNGQLGFEGRAMLRAFIARKGA